MNSRQPSKAYTDTWTVLSLWKGPLTPPAKFMAEIVQEVAEETGVPVHDILGKSTARRPTRARHQAMYRARQQRRQDGQFRFDLNTIGRFFGRDHSAVINGVRRHADRHGVPRCGL